MRLASNQLAVAAGIVVLPIFTFVVGWLQDVALPRSTIRADAAPAEWALPRQAERDLATDMNLLASKRPFGAAISAGAAPAGGVVGAAATVVVATASPAIQWRLGG